MRSYKTVSLNDAKILCKSASNMVKSLANDAKMLQTRDMTTFESYIKDATGERSLHAIERRTGIARATLTRKLKGIPPVETVVAICRAYGLSFTDVFVNAGYIRQDEADALAGEGALRQATDRQLAEEILRRAIEAEDSELNQPLQLVDTDPDYSKLSAEDVRNSYDLAALKKPEHIGDDELPNES